jgi:hypothetical protein
MDVPLSRAGVGVPLIGVHLLDVSVIGVPLIGVPSYGRACHGRPISIVAITGIAVKAQKGRIRYFDRRNL